MPLPLGGAWLHGNDGHPLRDLVHSVPDEFADEISLSGPRERIAERLEAWRKTPVTTLLIGGADPDTMRFLADQTR